MEQGIAFLGDLGVAGAGEVLGDLTRVVDKIAPRLAANGTSSVRLTDRLVRSALAGQLEDRRAYRRFTLSTQADGTGLASNSVTRSNLMP